MNTKLRQTVKNNLKKDFLKLLNNEVFGKTMETVRKHRNTKLVATEKKINCSVSDQIIILQRFLQKIYYQ